MMMAEQPKITVQISAEGAEQAQGKIRSFKQSLDELVRVASTMSLRLQQVAEQTRRTEQATQRLQASTGSLKQAFAGLATAVGAYISLDVGRRIIAQADELRMLESRLMLVTRNQNEYNASLKQVVQTSNAFGVTLSTASGIYQRFAIELTRMGKGNKEINQFFKTTVALGTVGSSSIQSMNAALQQLGQSLGGKVQADEFRSITEQAPLIAIALKEYLKVSTAELYKMFEDGKVKSKDLYDAIMTKGKEAEKIYANLPISVEKSFVRLQNTFGQAFLALDKGVGISQGLSQALNGVSNTIDFVSKNWKTFKFVIVDATIAVTAFALAMNFGKIVTATTTALAGMRTAVLAITATINPLYAVLTAVATVGIVLFTNNMIDGMDKTRKAVYIATGGMISDLDILGAKMAGIVAGVKAITTFKMPQLKPVTQMPSVPGFGGAIMQTEKGGSLLDVGKNFANHIETASKKAEEKALKQAGDRNAMFQRNMQGLGLGKTEPFKNVSEEGKKGKSGKSDAQKEAEAYTKSLDDLKKKATDASVSLGYMKASLALVQAGDLAGYEAKQKQIEAYEKVNSLLGDYKGKQRAELEQLARTTVAREQEAEAIKKQVEWFERLTKEKQKQAFDASQLDKLEASLKTGGLRGYEEQQRANSIEARRRELLGDITKPTDAQEEQAREQAQYEANLERRREALQRHVTEAQQARDAIGNALRTGFDNFSQYMLNGTMTFKEAMVGILRSLAVQLLKVYALKLALGFIAPRMTPAVGPAQPSAKIFDVLGSALGGQRAGGGSVSPNTPYVVGESGRELFVPQTAGNIVPNHAIGKQGASQGVTIVNNMTINTKEGDDKNSIMEAGKALTAMMEVKVREILRTESRQGGMLHRSFA